jgi:hypothetical protein
VILTFNFRFALVELVVVVVVLVVFELVSADCKPIVVVGDEDEPRNRLLVVSFALVVSY